MRMFTKNDHRQLNIKLNPKQEKENFEREMEIINQLKDVKLTEEDMKEDLEEDNKEGGGMSMRNSEMR